MAKPLNIVPADEFAKGAEQVIADAEQMIPIEVQLASLIQEHNAIASQINILKESQRSLLGKIRAMTKSATKAPKKPKTETAAPVAQ